MSMCIPLLPFCVSLPPPNPITITALQRAGRGGEARRGGLSDRRRARQGRGACDGSAGLGRGVPHGGGGPLRDGRGGGAGEWGHRQQGDFSFFRSINGPWDLLKMK